MAGWRYRLIGVIQPCHPASSSNWCQRVAVGKMGWSRTNAVRMSKFYLVARATPTTKAAPVLAPCGARPPTSSAALEAWTVRRVHATSLIALPHDSRKTLKAFIGSFAPDKVLTLFVTVKSGVVRRFAAWRAGLRPHQQSALGCLNLLGQIFVGGSPQWW